MTSAHFPDGKQLTYGTATASYQVEGSTRTDGRGPSIWDTFTARSGTIVDGSDGSDACGSYERLDDDLTLLGDLGVAFYRFSIAWPRIQPAGQGRIEPRGFGYYDRLVDGLLGRGIAPMATLYHWDLPQPLEDAGGWPARDTALRFADYAATVHDHLGDRVKVWATLNEPWCSAFLGYAAGKHAPGRRDGDAAFGAAHHLLLGHGLAAQRLHEAGAEDVGIVLNLTPVWPESEAAGDAARVVDAIHNRIWLDPLVHGRYADDLLAIAAPLADSDMVRDGDLAAVAGTLDWLGVNYYTPARVDVAAPATTGGSDRGGSDSGGSDSGSGEGGVGQDTRAYPGLESAAFHPRQPRTAMGWEIEPRGLEDLLVQTAQRAPGIPQMVTENGAAFDDQQRDASGAVDDPDRIDYLDTHIAAVERARQAGVDVRAYIAWTLLDNFEWAEGYTKKFGLVEVEGGTLRRVPKASYRWYADRIRAGR